MIREENVTVPESARRMFEVSGEEAGRRADVVIAHRMPELSRSRIQKLIEGGIIRRAAKGELKPGSRLAAGERIEIGDVGTILPPDGKPEPEPEPIPLTVVWEDEHLLVIDKPPGLVVHPAAGRRAGTLVNALLHRYRELPRTGGSDRPGIVHRLDRDTSGLLVVAKNEYAQRVLSRQFQERRVKKEYRAVVWGELNRDRVVLDGSIGRSPRDRKRMAVGGKKSREALTRIEVAARFPGFTYLKVFPETGRTHQIRVHVAEMGHPVVGDQVYGKSRRVPKSLGPKGEEAIRALPGFALHAHRLEFAHPVSGERMSAVAPLPESFAALLRVLGSDR